MNNGFDYENLVTTTLSSKRAKHSFGVAKLAKSIAKANGVDQDDAYIAGLLHDITKEFSSEYQYRTLKEHNDLDKLTLPLKVQHAYTAKYYLQDVLGINKENILDAVYNHTICNSNEKLAKIIFIADKREENRGIDDGVAKLAHVNLDEAYRLIKEDVEKYLKSKGIK